MRDAVEKRLPEKSLEERLVEGQATTQKTCPSHTDFFLKILRMFFFF